MLRPRLIAAFLYVLSGAFALPGAAAGAGFDTAIPVILNDKAEVPVPGEAFPVLKSPGDLSVWGQFVAVKELRLETSCRCEAGVGHYTAAKAPQHFSILINDSNTYFQLPAGYEISLDGDRPGAKFYLKKPSVQDKTALGTAGQPFSKKCVFEGSEYLPLKAAAAVSASRGKRVRTGFLRPACYKNLITGTSTLDYWNILRVAFEGGSMEMQTASSESFLNREDCLSFYQQIRRRGMGSVYPEEFNTGANKK